MNRFSAARRERADVVAHEARALATREERQFHRQMVMPVQPFASDSLRAPVREQQVHVAQVSRPAQGAEGMPAVQPDAFVTAFHAA